MSKIYVFGIGGTGSRVMRALTMLLASGVECKADTIVPIIIDPDAAGGDVERTGTLMRHYGEIRSRLSFSNNVKNNFFRTEIKNIMNDFHLPLSNTEDCLFEDYLGVDKMTKPNKALVNVLFSKKNLGSNMKVGFKGNPNVGSVVLNQFEDSPEFQNFANDFTDNDKIFIISSIFGGTGASGFPLLLKTLRTSTAFANQNLVNNAHIGAITVLPYFKVKQDEKSQIDSTTFISKAKSALSYYERTISRAKINKANMIDNMYYIADDTRATAYENCEGGTNQKNNAHFVEMVSALAVIDFANSSKPSSTIHKEFGIEKDTNEIIFENLGPDTKTLLSRSLTQFLLFAKFFDENDNNFLQRPWAVDRKLDETFFRGDYMKNLKKNILQEYQVWLKEMSEQDRKFIPFEIHRNVNRVFDLVKGVPPRSKFLVFDDNYNLFNGKLNSTDGTSKLGEKEQQLMELFYLATRDLVKDKFNII